MRGLQRIILILVSDTDSHVKIPSGAASMNSLKQFCLNFCVEVLCDVGGMDKQIQELVEAVVRPMTHSHLFKEIGIKAPKGVLLFGPVCILLNMYFCLRYAFCNWMLTLLL